MATPPFDPDETKPAPSDLISQYPTVEQAFRDVIESWILIDHNRDGQHDKVTLEDQEGSEPAGTADHITLFNDDGVLAYRVGTAAIQNVLDETTADAAYLKLTGGTLTGALSIKGGGAGFSNALFLRDDNGAIGARLQFLNANRLVFAGPATSPSNIRFQKEGDLDLDTFEVRRSGGLQEIYARDNRSTQAQAEAGSNNDAVMTPLRTKQAISALAIPTDSVGANGHLELPNGVILQWGRASRTSSPQTISFPRTFPNNVFSVQVTLESTAGIGLNGDSSIGSTRTTSQFSVHSDGSTTHINWFAVGN